MKILIKFPTRERPATFLPLLHRYIRFLSGKNDVRFVITCDEDDHTMNNITVKKQIADLAKLCDLKLCYGHSKTKVEAINSDLVGENANVLLVASDDMVPLLEGYDEFIADGFRQEYPQFDGALGFSDGRRTDDLVTLPCMGWRLYKAIGHIYHPDYYSVFCDDEQTLICRALNKLVYSSQCIIEHRWKSRKHERADSLHQRNEDPTIYAHDRKVFERRMRINFEANQVWERLVTSNQITSVM